ncbi:hypothetical protein N656DRAFT_774384 [Canariomyces notabilis]|uniref:Uncharacterized protein n=1 Tax=Canariomyces notabilis TaxID=2074819 RepID=A0AAN6YWK0_9PEZI|nr:hypothetical protein N656DRAFT_774384 [Canariomyces arenarius]
MPPSFFQRPGSRHITATFRGSYVLKALKLTGLASESLSGGSMRVSRKPAGGQYYSSTVQRKLLIDRLMGPFKPSRFANCSHTCGDSRCDSSVEAALGLRVKRQVSIASDEDIILPRPLEPRPQAVASCMYIVQQWSTWSLPLGLSPHLAIMLQYCM